MFENLIENRYPFDNAIQFFVEGYWLHLESLHLTLGWLFIVFLTFRLACENIPLSLKLSILFFSLVIFNNPAYDLGGFRLNELFGILAIVLGTVMRKVPKFFIGAPVVRSMLLIFIIGIVHGILVSIAYPELNKDFATGFTRVAVNLRVLVVALNLAIVSSFLKRGLGLNILIRSIVIAGTFSLLMYLLQGLVLIGARTLPYGTFLDAGFIGFPSFGSTSIERGHFGKFMAPLFPFFLYAMLAWRWWQCFLLFTFIFLINFSASAQVFFASFTLIALYKFIFLFKRKSFLLFFSIVTILTITLVTSYDELFLGIVEKIYETAFKGDEIGGRGLGLLPHYIDRYPLGIGYSGSTLRTAPGLPEINAAHLAFITQYSFVSPLVLGTYIFLTVTTLQVSRNSGLLAKSMTVGVLGSSVIFFADILWFIPTIWLSYLIAWHASGRSTASPVNTYDNVAIQTTFSKNTR
jgi:hypothetical protein